MKLSLGIFALFLSISFSTFSQDALKEGYRILGGGLNFSLGNIENNAANPNFFPSETTSSKSSGFSIRSYYGRLFQDYSMIGARLNFGAQSSEVESEFDRIPVSSNENDQLSFGAGFFIRRYFPATEKFGIFIETGIDYLRTISEQENTFVTVFQDGEIVEQSRSEFETKTHNASLNFDVGLYFFLLPELSIETRLGQALIGFSDTNTSFQQTPGITQPGLDDREGSATNFNLNLINQISFNQLFTLNYFF